MKNEQLRWLLSLFAAASGLLALLGVVSLNNPYPLRGLDLAIIGTALLLVFYVLWQHEERLEKIGSAKRR